MKPPHGVKCDNPLALFLHAWGVVDQEARVQADGPWRFRQEVPYCITSFRDKVCRCGLFELLDIRETVRNVNP